MLWSVASLKETLVGFLYLLVERFISAERESLVLAMYGHTTSPPLQGMACSFHLQSATAVEDLSRPKKFTSQGFFLLF